MVLLTWKEILMARWNDLQSGSSSPFAMSTPSKLAKRKIFCNSFAFWLGAGSLIRTILNQFRCEKR